jgi:hypothetical protein
MRFPERFVAATDGRWAFFPDFNTITLADRATPCFFAAAR